jgi:uncharacterized coiled-coil protein SlyX
LCFEKVKLLRGHTGEVLRKIVRLKNEIARLEQTSSTKDERIKQLEETIATKDERIQQLEDEVMLPKCTVCYDRPAVRVLLRCGHRVVCNKWRCVSDFRMNNDGTCPLCRQPRYSRPRDISHCIYD